MAIYIQLMTLTAEGREKVLEDAESVLRAQDTIMASDIQVLGQYGVLGPYDYVGFVEAPDKEAIARFSLELGVRVGAHITTLPAIPMGRLNVAFGRESRELETGATPPAG